jgi:hypothetical protein
MPTFAHSGTCIGVHPRSTARHRTVLVAKTHHKTTRKDMLAKATRTHIEKPPLGQDRSDTTRIRSINAQTGRKSISTFETKPVGPRYTRIDRKRHASGGRARISQTTRMHADENLR